MFLLTTDLCFIISIKQMVVSFKKLSKLENEILQKNCGASGLTQEVFDDYMFGDFKVAYNIDALVGDFSRR